MKAEIVSLIPCYDNVDSIERTIASCLMQTPNPTVFVIDNGSSDGTRELLVERYSNDERISLYFNDSNLGRVGNWNRAIELAFEKGFSFIHFVFPGEELAINCHKEVLNAIEEFPFVAAVAFQYKFVGSNFEFINDEKLEGLIPPQKVLELNVLNGGFLGTIVSNVYSMAAVGKRRFDTNHVGKSEFDFSILDGYHAYYIPKVLATTNAKFRKTLDSSMSYWFEMESAGIRSRWLEKKRDYFTTSQYNFAKEQIMISLIERSARNYDSTSYFRIGWLALNIAARKRISEIRSKFAIRTRILDTLRKLGVTFKTHGRIRKEN